MKTKKTDTKEIKRAGSYKMKPSVKAMAMEFIDEDPDTKSFNDLLEVAVVDYIRRRKRVPRDHEKQAKIDYTA